MRKFSLKDVVSKRVWGGNEFSAEVLDSLSDSELELLLKKLRRSIAYKVSAVLLVLMALVVSFHYSSSIESKLDSPTSQESRSVEVDAISNHLNQLYGRKVWHFDTYDVSRDAYTVILPSGDERLFRYDSKTKTVKEVK